MTWREWIIQGLDIDNTFVSIISSVRLEMAHRVSQQRGIAIGGADDDLLDHHLLVIRRCNWPDARTAVKQTGKRVYFLRPCCFLLP